MQSVLLRVPGQDSGVCSALALVPEVAPREPGARGAWPFIGQLPNLSVLCARVCACLHSCVCACECVQVCMCVSERACVSIYNLACV